MTTLLRRYIFPFIAALGLSLPAAAVTASIDYSDLWYNAPAESQSGWGVNVMQQNNILFVTLFVYGSDNTPRWYVASNVISTGGTSFTGALYSVGSGTWFGAPWTGISGTQQVGTIAFTFNSPTTGTMVYSVNNVQVTKNIVRQTWQADNLSGNYIGGLVASGAQCGANGILIHGNLTVNHSHPNISFTVDFVNGNGVQSQCIYTGQYSQVGSVGSVGNGTYQCTFSGTANPLQGTFSLSEMRNTRNGFNGRVTGQDGFCAYNGYFGGVRDVL
jgi:hypothetical protein